MASGTGLDKFAKEFPNRFFDVGIAEQHAVTFAGGLATNGFKPVVAIYSTFLQRAYDQIIHDICLQNLPVTFAIDRAGLVGEDGPTHHGTLDLSYLRTIPNLAIMAPKDENELGHMLKTAIDLNSPVALRYPRGEAVGAAVENPLETIQIPKAELLKQGKDILILAAGPIVYAALAAANELERLSFPKGKTNLEGRRKLSDKKKLSCCVVNARFIKPLDEETILTLTKKIKKIITIEENTIEGGFGSAILELLEKNNIKADIKRIGIPDKFIEHGSQEQLKKDIGLTKANIIKQILALK